MASSLNSRVVWAVAGVLASSLAEYSSRTILPHPEQRLRLEWMSWATCLAGARATLFLQRWRRVRGAAKDTSQASTSPSLGQLNAAVVVLCNLAARYLLTIGEVEYTLVCVIRPDCLSLALSDFSVTLGSPSSRSSYARLPLSQPERNRGNPNQTMKAPTKSFHAPTPSSLPPRVLLRLALRLPWS